MAFVPRPFTICCILTATMLTARPSEHASLRLVQTISMPHVTGRIDHMAYDIEHGRLYVAALGNGTLEVVDVQAARVARTVQGLQEPQGVLYLPEIGRLFVATGGDGKCHVYSGDALRELSSIAIGADADNVRYDQAGRRVYVGYGNGALAVLDPDSLNRLADIRLAGHPESFQIEKTGPKIYVNVPDARHVAVVDRVQQKLHATFPLGNLQANFPMALNEADHELLVATRSPPKLVVLDSGSGRKLQELDCAADADDLFYDAEARCVYVSCGGGSIDVFARHDHLYSRLARVPTSSGARTCLWVPELKRLFLAVPGRGGQRTAIRVYARE